MALLPAQQMICAGGMEKGTQTQCANADSNGVLDCNIDLCIPVYTVTHFIVPDLGFGLMICGHARLETSLHMTTAVVAVWTCHADPSAVTGRAVWDTSFSGF